MNPFDNQELVVFDKTMRADMPYHRDNRIEIKRPFSQGLPKNIMSYSEKIDKKFIDKYGHVIEEMNHRKPDNYIAKWFKAYQKKIYGKTEILNHDNFFKADLPGHGRNIFQDEFGYPKNTKHFMGNTRGLFNSLASGPVDGPELEFAPTAASSGAWGANAINIFRYDGVTANPTDLYDEFAYKGRTGSCNFRGGIYDDLSTFPDNLLSETASYANSGGSYVYQSVPEFAMVTAVFWLAGVMDNAGFGGFFESASGDREAKSFTFGALPDPAGAGYSNDTSVETFKIRHT